MSVQGAGTKVHRAKSQPVALLSALGCCSALAGCSAEAPFDLESTARDEAPLQGGFRLTGNNLSRSGIYRLGSVCTATVLSTSQRDRTTWALTAAHCYDDPGDSFALVRDGRAATYQQGTVFRHPSYTSVPVRDLALVRFPEAVSITGPDGVILREYRRAIYSGAIANLEGRFADIFGSGDNDNTPGDQCDPDPSGTGAGDGSVRHLRNLFWGNGHGTVKLGLSGAIPSGSAVHHGDSGGPWIYSDGTPAPASDTLLNRGLVVAVTSATSCDIFHGNDAYLASTTTGDQNQSFLEDHMGAALVTSTGSWSLGCPSNAVSDRGRAADRSCICSAADTQSGSVRGTGIYTDDSRICRAALHAGVIPSGGGTVNYELVAGQSSYAGTTQNGVTSSASGSAAGSYRFMAPTRPCPANAVAQRGQNGLRTTCFCSTAASNIGRVWGTSTYTDDSNICLAARHVGLFLYQLDGGLVTYEIRPGQSSYSASDRYGVESLSYGSWVGSFTIL
ncbi:MAG TPA: LCCL domain-containing protein [Polyangiaceae bacterium]